MATQTPKPVIHVYKEFNVGKCKTVKYYELIECSNTPIFTTQIHISLNQNCAQSTPDYWLKIREGKKWGRYITGLFKTHFPSIYKGDTQRKKNLVIFKFSHNENILTIECFKDYYTNDLNKIIS